MAPLLNFPAYLWIFVAIFCFFAAFLYTLIKRMSHKVYTSKFIHIHYSNYLILTLLYAFNSPVLRQGSAVLQSERVFIITLSFLGLVLSTLFESFLKTNLVTPLFWQRNIETMEDLDASNLPIEVRFPSIMEDLFPDNTSKTYQSLRQHLILVPYDNYVLARMAAQGSFSIPVRKSLVHLDYSEWFQSDELHMIPECPKNYLLAFPISKHSVFLERFNWILLKLSEGGLIKRWMEEMFLNHTIMNAYEKKDQLLNEPKFLKLTDMQFPFYTLFFGTCLSVAVAFIEIFGLKVRRLLRKYGI